MHCYPVSTTLNPKSELENRKPPTRWFVALIGTALLSVFMAAIASVVPMMVGFASIAGLVPTLWSSFRDTRRKNPLAFGVASVLIAMCGFFGTVYAAHLAPFKTTESYLNRTLELPRTTIALRELACLDDDYRATLYLRGITVSISDDQVEQKVTFPSTKLSLREFVDAVERQTSLRHRFGHCGNGSSILWGGDCSFGLQLRPEPSWGDSDDG